MYSLEGYGDMLADKIRHDAFCRAMRQIAKPGSVVLEIGTGPGFFAVLACQAGARRVFAIESGEVIQVAREIAIANGCADRIEFFEDVSTKVTLPERADAIFSDLRGVLPLFEHHIPSIIDARSRFLKPGGILCPRKDTIWLAPAEVPKIYSKMMDSWDQPGSKQDLSAARKRIVNTLRRERATSDQLLADPQVWVTLDYSRIESPDQRGEVQWTANRAGTAHGMLAWFDADLAEGAFFSTSPFGPDTVYASMFFPWLHPVELDQGDTVCVYMEAKLTGEDYVFRWSTQVKPGRLRGQTNDNFEQSTLGGVVLSPERLRKAASNHIPSLTVEGTMARRVLDLVDCRATLEDIARTLTAEYPDRLATWHDALKFASALSQKYSR